MKSGRYFEAMSLALPTADTTTAREGPVRHVHRGAKEGSFVPRDLFPIPCHATLAWRALRAGCIVHEIQVFIGHHNDLHSELDACFAPNAQHALSSCPARTSTNGIYLLYTWPTEDGKLDTRFSPKGLSSAVGEVIASA
ncbi:unnamed protein product [Ectocarpus sp. 8 AP-2014]